MTAAEIALLDFSGTKPDPGQLVRGGYRGVLGYVSNTPAKNLTGPQAAAYRAAGLMVGYVWETTADRVLSGAAGGAVDAAAAGRQLDAIGYPADAVIFAAIDYAEPASDFPVAARYLAEFDAGQRRPVGVYGDYLVIEHFVTPGIRPVRYGWQTAAWSSGLLSGKAHLYQRSKPSGHWPVVSGTDEDVLCLPLPLWGASAPAPPPAPRPTPAPAPRPVPVPPPAPRFDVRNWRIAQGQSDPHLPALWGWANRMYPGYDSTPITWAPGVTTFGPQTVRFLAEFEHRTGNPTGNGTVIGPQTAASLYAAGLRG